MMPQHTIQEKAEAPPSSGVDPGWRHAGFASPTAPHALTLRCACFRLCGRPAREFIEALHHQGWPTAEAPWRGWLHLGRLFYQACMEGCTKSGKPAAPEIWELWMVTCGLTDLDEAMELLGKLARLVVPVMGPLCAAHVHVFAFGLHSFHSIISFHSVALASAHSCTQPSPAQPSLA